MRLFPLLGRAYEDKDAQERIVRRSQLQWIIDPAGLPDGSGERLAYSRALLFVANRPLEDPRLVCPVVALQQVSFVSQIERRSVAARHSGSGLTRSAWVNMRGECGTRATTAASLSVQASRFHDPPQECLNIPGSGVAGARFGTALAAKVDHPYGWSIRTWCIPRSAAIVHRPWLLGQRTKSMA